MLAVITAFPSGRPEWRNGRAERLASLFREREDMLGKLPEFGAGAGRERVLIQHRHFCLRI